MNASTHTAKSSTSIGVPEGMRDASASFDEDDFALGCESANPALQIEVWGREAMAQPLQQAAC